MSFFKVKSTCIVCNKKFKPDIKGNPHDARHQNKCYDCRQRIYGVSDEKPEGPGLEYFETRWINGAVIIDTHNACKDKNKTLAVFSGEYYFDLTVQNNTADTVREIVTLKVNGSKFNYSPQHFFYLLSGDSSSFQGKVLLKAGDIVSWETDKLTITRFSLRRNAPSRVVYGCPLTDPVKFSGGSFVRRGEYMIVYCDNNYFENKPVYDFLPTGFDYDMSSLTFVPTDNNKVKIHVKVKGWGSVVLESEPIKFKAPKETLSNYKFSAEFNTNVPGVYEIDGRKITLKNGEMAVGLKDSDIKNGIIKVPIKKK